MAIGKPCPLCQTEINLIQINYDEAMEMCTNRECVYPFTFPKIQYNIVSRNYREARTKSATKLQKTKSLNEKDPAIQLTEELNRPNNVVFNEIEEFVSTYGSDLTPEDATDLEFENFLTEFLGLTK